MANQKLGGRLRAGRPPKFNETSRPVTVTLPRRILDLLAQVDPDRARAITRVTECAIGRDAPEKRPMELIEIEPGRYVLVVAQHPALRRIPWLRLVEIAPARHLLVISPGTPIEMLEVALLDLIEAASATEDLGLLKKLRVAISQFRRSGRVAKGELLFFTREPHGAALELEPAPTDRQPG